MLTAPGMVGQIDGSLVKIDHFASGGSPWTELTVLAVGNENRVRFVVGESVEIGDEPA